MEDSLLGWWSSDLVLFHFPDELMFIFFFFLLLERQAGHILWTGCTSLFSKIQFDGVPSLMGLGCGILPFCEWNLYCYSINKLQSFSSYCYAEYGTHKALLSLNKGWIDWIIWMVACLLWQCAQTVWGAEEFKIYCILGHGKIVNILRSGVGGHGFARSVPTPSTVRISELF